MRLRFLVLVAGACVAVVAAAGSASGSRRSAASPGYGWAGNTSQGPVHNVDPNLHTIGPVGVFSQKKSPSIQFLSNLDETVLFSFTVYVRAGTCTQSIAGKTRTIEDAWVPLLLYKRVVVRDHRFTTVQTSAADRYPVFPTATAEMSGTVNGASASGVVRWTLGDVAMQFQTAMNSHLSCTEPSGSVTWHVQRSKRVEVGVVPR